MYAAFPTGSEQEKFRCIASNVGDGEFIWSIANKMVKNENRMKTISESEYEETYTIKLNEIDDPVEMLDKKYMKCK